MDVVEFLEEVRECLPERLCSRVDAQLGKMKVFFSLDPGFRRFIESTPDGKKGKRDLRRLLEEITVQLIDKPELVSKGLEIITIVN